MKRPIEERGLSAKRQAECDGVLAYPMADSTLRRAPRIQHERGEAEALWQAAQYTDWCAYLYHWPNERRSAREAHRLSQQGVQPGPPDYWLLLPRCGCPLAALELKRRDAKPSSVTAPQRRVLGQLEAVGAACWVARGWNEAFDWLAEYAAGELLPRERWWEQPTRRTK